MTRRESSLDDLIRAQRESGGMTAVQRAHNRARLLSGALAGTAASAASVSVASTIAAATRTSAQSWIGKVSIGLVLAGATGTAYVATRPAAVRAAPAAAQSALKTAPAPEPATPRASPAPATSESTPASPSTRPRAARPALASPSLAVEVQLMHDVDSALQAGRPELALALLDEHRGGDGGFMGEERTAARIVTLCQLGRVDAARTEATRFLHDRPRSPLAARVRATCVKPVANGAAEKLP
jgi:hypothetical protein